MLQHRIRKFVYVLPARKLLSRNSLWAMGFAAKKYLFVCTRGDMMHYYDDKQQKNKSDVGFPVFNLFKSAEQ